MRTWTTDGLSGSGTCRVAFGRDETVETIPGTIDTKNKLSELLKKGAGRMDPNCGTVIEAGKVKLLPRRVGSDFIEMVAVGNPGLIREITALDAEGNVLASEIPGECCFSIKESWFSINGIIEPEKIRSWRVRYFRDSEWSESRFDFHIPPDKE